MNARAYVLRSCDGIKCFQRELRYVLEGNARLYLFCRLGAGGARRHRQHHIIHRSASLAGKRIGLDKEKKKKKKKRRRRKRKRKKERQLRVVL